MDKSFPLEERSLKQIYISSQEVMTYMIPVYQRNYAWEEDEIAALIKDVYDSFIKNKDAYYYIGTLVTYLRDDHVYEVIDGQQRLTTIYIVLKALGINDIKNRLTYRARKVSATTIENLPDFGDEVDEGIRRGFEIAKRVIDRRLDDTERELFTSYFLDKVHIIHYSVPKDVDLNHYFEVMNSRGEQLEKHEIVKSMLGQPLKEQELVTFSRIWEACSEMNVYIQQTFDDKEVFGPHLEDFNIDSFDGISKHSESNGKTTVSHLLGEPIRQMKVSSAKERSDRFQPIIDFSNFLLIVLKVTLMDYEGFDPLGFALDDKELLKEFKNAFESERIKNQKDALARQFAFNLLKARYNLDNYVVHHSNIDKEMSGDNPWKLQYYYQDRKKKYPINLAGQKEQEKQEELIHLLSMFEVSFTPKQRKNYLFYCMLFLFKNNEPSVDSYLDFLKRLAKKYFYAVYLNPESLNERNLPGPNEFDKALLKDGQLNLDNTWEEDVDFRVRFEEIYRQGRSYIPLYVFNYTDYILWKKYSDELRGKQSKLEDDIRRRFFGALGCSDFGLDPFSSFYFSRTRRSLEHYYPQAKADEGKVLSSSDINCFGNFAMIGAEANSSGSNWDPKQKLDHYNDAKSDPVSVASLKFKIMMQMCKDNCAAKLKGILPENRLEWDAEDMQVHQEKMLDIIFAKSDYQATLPKDNEM
ncbi:MAG: DUF262 domain-containing protein [Bacteroidales bacterium]|nr:DUF262 domain-containing protein [Bacteroidales bacterium]